jgi:hypothetical protein
VKREEGSHDRQQTQENKRYLAILAREFRAGKGSFLLQLRIDMLHFICIFTN